VLFATDVASRGLNLPDVDWIVQYDPPGEVAEYVHRAGRVARAGKAGHSLLFLLPSETPFLDVLKKRGVKRLSALSLSSTLKSAADVCTQVTTEGMRHAGGGSFSGFKPTASAGRIGEAFASEVQRRLEACVAADDAKVRATEKAARKQRRAPSATVEASPSDGLMELARNAFVSHLRSYPTKEKLVRHIFSAKALHLGHVARSFALKEPPKRLATMASKQTAVVVEQSETRKRNTTMAFGSLDDDVIGSDNAVAQKRSRPSSAQSTKSIFLSKAKKMQASGLDGL
jgi:ATP-dependent RNA helicase DDX31/DBP7